MNASAIPEVESPRREQASGKEFAAKRFLIVLSRPFDMAGFDASARADRSPRHALSVLRDAIEVRIIQPVGARRSIIDRIRYRFPGVGTVEHWALARQLVRDVGDGDVIFSIGEDTGFPIAALLGKTQSKARICVFVHHVDRPRVKYMFWRNKLRDHVDFFITNTKTKADFLNENLGVPKERIFYICEQTDTEFFRPVPPSAGKQRPIIGSGGLEQRDYVTLAEATKDMDVDVRVCAMSPNATALRDTFPDPLPSNMSVNRYDWCGLRQLYCDSDVVVISLKQHNYQAGLTTLFESLACQRPVVMTNTVGIVDEFASAGFLTPVPPGDPIAMRSAILRLLDDPDLARRQAQLGREAVLKTYTCERMVSDLVEKLTSL